MKLILNIVIGLVLLNCEFVFSQAVARTVESARQSGEANEGSDGYLKATSQDPDVKKFVDDVNKKRREEYQRIAAKNKQDVATVAREAAQKLGGR